MFTEFGFMGFCVHQPLILTHMLCSGHIGHVVAIVSATYVFHSGRSGHIQKLCLYSKVVGHYGHYTNNRRPLHRPLRSRYGHYRS